MNRGAFRPGGDLSPVVALAVVEVATWLPTGRVVWDLLVAASAGPSILWAFYGGLVCLALLLPAAFGYGSYRLVRAGRWTPVVSMALVVTGIWAISGLYVLAGVDGYRSWSMHGYQMYLMLGLGMGAAAAHLERFLRPPGLRITEPDGPG
jgi:hypothetical protein